MNTQFVTYSDLNEAAETITRESKCMDSHSVLFWAIYELCGMVEFFTFAEYGDYAEFTGAPKYAYHPDIFGLCVFDNKEDYLAFWKFCNER